jgi:DNA-binding MarR family transcriptional regulator
LRCQRDIESWLRAGSFERTADGPRSSLRVRIFGQYKYLCLCNHRKYAYIARMLEFPPDMDPLAVALIMAVVPLIKDSQTEVMTATAEFDLTMSQLRMLFVLDKARADLAVNEVADQVSLSMAAAGRAVDGLVRSGLLSRREDSLDRRIKRIGLTDAGKRAIEQIGAARRHSVERFVDALNKTERAALTAAVATLGELTRKHFPGLLPPT